MLKDLKLSRGFSALSEPGRLKIFRYLLSHRDVCVSDIAATFKISVPRASQQLKILEWAGFVERIRQGQMICYEVKREDPLVRSFIRILFK